jgi:hypothetical protein
LGQREGTKNSVHLLIQEESNGAFGLSSEGKKLGEFIFQRLIYPNVCPEKSRLPLLGAQVVIP